MSGLGPIGCWELRLFGQHVDQAFGHVPYHVGSSLAAQKGDRWRDVDVRLILPDDEFAGYFGDITKPWRASALTIWNAAWSAYGQRMTRLPVDFQIQPQTEANNEDGPRSALIILDTDLPFVRTGKRGGDA